MSDLLERLRGMAEVGYGTAGEAVTEIEALQSRLGSVLGLLTDIREDLKQRGICQSGNPDAYVVNIGSTLWNRLCDAVVEKRENLTEGEDYLADGFGGVWERCERRHLCDMQIVRPGKCVCEADDCPRKRITFSV